MLIFCEPFKEQMNETMMKYDVIVIGHTNPKMDFLI